MRIYLKDRRSRNVSQVATLLRYADSRSLFSHAGDGEGESSEENEWS